MEACQDEIDKKIEPGLQAAYDAIGFGAMTKIAAAFGLTRQAVSAWRRVPADRVVQLEARFGVPREIMRPDLYR